MDTGTGKSYIIMTNRPKDPSLAVTERIRAFLEKRGARVSVFADNEDASRLGLAEETGENDGRAGGTGQKDRHGRAGGTGQTGGCGQDGPTCRGLLHDRAGRGRHHAQSGKVYVYLLDPASGRKPGNHGLPCRGGGGISGGGAGAAAARGLHGGGADDAVGKRQTGRRKSGNRAAGRPE